MMAAEIPIWVDGSCQWLSGVDRRTTFRDVLELFAEGAGGNDVSNYEMVEQWKEVERPLDLGSRVHKVSVPKMIILHFDLIRKEIENPQAI